MKRLDKKALVERLRSDLEPVGNLILTEYRGMTVEQMTDFRNRVRTASGSVRVMKNTLLRRAVGETDKAVLLDMLEGPNALVFGDHDPVTLVSVVAGVSKEIEALRIKGGIVEGQAMTAEEILRIADLPSRAELLARALGSMCSPLRGLLNVFQGTARNLVCVVEAIRLAKVKASGT
jgi:large subunit ribosomal protein L10